MVLIAPSSPAITASDTQNGGKKSILVFKLDRKSYCRSKTRTKALKLLRRHPGVESVACNELEETFELIGDGIDPTAVMKLLRKKFRNSKIMSRGLATTIVSISELQEQSDEQQEDQPPPGQADSFLSQVEASPLSHPLPSPSLTVASNAQPSFSPVSHPSRGTSDQMQAPPDHTPELPFSSAPLSPHMCWAKSLADMLTHSSISGGACLPKDMKLMEEKGPGGHDQLYDSAILYLHLGIGGIGELKRQHDLHAEETASRLKKADDTAIMLSKQVEELEAKLWMANMPERHLMDMVCTSEDRTKTELALMREKMDEANRRIEYLEAEVSRYQNRIAVAEREKEKAEERASRASAKGETISSPRPSPPAPWRTSLNFVALLLLVLVSRTWRCARKALFFLNMTSYLDSLE